MSNDTEVQKEAANSPLEADVGRLDGWKEIASFFGRGIRTVRRWEKDAELPIRRLFKHRRSPVHAYPRELAVWIKAREEHHSLPSHLTSQSRLDEDLEVSTPRDVLDGWKEIAAFLGRSVRTVQRREKEMGLPVRRVQRKGRSLPYAHRCELAAWLRNYRTPTGLTGEGGLGPSFSHLLQSMVDGWSDCIAVLNKAGTIVAVNRAWEQTFQALSLRSTYCGVGIKYLDLCKSLSLVKGGPTPIVTEGITELLRGARRSLQIRYRANTATEKRWFLLQSARFDFQGESLLALIHTDVTELLGD